MGIFNYYPSNPKKLDPEMEKRIFIHSLIFSAAFVLVFWIVEIIEQTLGATFVRLGVYPLHLKGLPGILFSPFIHSDFNHLISNSIPFFILMFMLIYFYRRISYRIFIQLYLLSGVCVWLSGREAWHIGASGVVYAMAAFHFVSGVIRNDVRLLTLSVTVVFLYGGLVWGMFPINPDVSWEGHLWGAVSGVGLALYYRKYTIRRDKFDWEDEMEDEEVDSDQSQWAVSQEKIDSIPSQSQRTEGYEKTGNGQLQRAESQGKVDSDQSQLEEEESEQSKSTLAEGKNNKVNQKPENMSHTGEF